MPTEKQGPTIVLSLENNAPGAILALKDEKISANNGVDITIKRLDTIYKIDETLGNYTALEAFATFKRPEYTSINLKYYSTLKGPMEHKSWKMYLQISFLNQHT